MDMSSPASLTAPVRASGHVVSAHDQIVRALAQDILTGTLAPGDKLPVEADLLERFGVSRTALREALKTLSAKGFLSVKTRVGTRVTDSVHWNFFDKEVLAWRVAIGMDAEFRRHLAEVRRSLEPTAASLAARHRTGSKPTVVAHSFKTGSLLQREWQGERHPGEVVEGGYVWKGQRYKSLSAIAREITGSRWNGPRFFGLREDQA